MDEHLVIRRPNYSTLLRINRLLNTRVRKLRLFYSVIVSVISIFLLLFMGGMLLSSSSEPLRDSELKSIFLAAGFVLFSFDTLLTLLRFQSGTLIEFRHLAILPASRFQILVFNLMVDLTDLKSLMYLSIVLPLFIFLIVKASMAAALLSILSLALFLLATESLLMLAVRVTTWFPASFRRNSGVLYYLLMWFFLAVMLTRHYPWFGSIPPVSFLGDCLFALAANNIFFAILNMGFLALTSLIAVLACAKIQWKV